MLPSLLAAALAAAPLVPSPAPQRPQEPTIGFEKLREGPFTRLRARYGTFVVESGEARVDPTHAHRGSKCLHLLGGDETAVRFEAALDDLFELRFMAERWTRNSPFRFVVEGEVDGAWKVLHDGSDSIVIGGFKTLVQVPVPAGVRTFRLVCTSPPEKGILIDDLQIVPRAPMVLESVAATQPVLPVLVGLEQNPILRLDPTVSGNEDPVSIDRVVLDLEGTTVLDDVVDVQLFQGPARLPGSGPAETFAAEDRFGEPALPGKGPLTFEGSWTPGPGREHLWVSVRVREGADLDGRVDARLLGVRADGAVEVPVVEGAPEGAQRLGVALRTAGQDGVAVHRIPGLATSNAGTLLAVYDFRYRGWGDLPGHIDVALSRSTDGGTSWEEARVVMDMGSDPAFAHDGVGDPAILVDRTTGTIWIVASWHHGNLGWNRSGPGFEPEQTGQLVLVRSDDDGVTWSEPINITRQVKQEEWCFLLQGPGRGITMEDGTLVFPAQYQLSPAERREPRSTVLWSKDHGATWSLGTTAKPNTTEAAVVETRTGTLMLNMRDNRGGSRAIATTTDLGRTWAPHATSRSALVEPVCMASLLHVGRELTGRADGVLLFSNPAVDRAPRRRMTIKASRDHGESWSERHQVLLDAGQSAGYSCLSMVDADTVGIVYEGSRAQLTYQRVKLAELGL